MTTHYYGVDVGGRVAKDVTDDSSTTSSDIELVVTTDATNINKISLILAIDAIRAAVLQDEFPPA